MAQLAERFVGPAVTLSMAVLLVAAAAGTVPATGGESTGRNGRIVFQASAGAQRQLFAINPDGSGLRQVTRLAGSEQPDWSPDGSRIAFDAPGAGGTRILTVRPDGSDTRAVPLTTGGSSAAPAYSPDGGSLAFEHRARSSRPGEHGIFVVSVEGGKPRRVTTGGAMAGAYDTAATWSPDGARLAFTRVRSAQQAAVFLVRADGSGLRRLTPWSLDASAASWSPDGATLVFESYATPHPGKSANLFTILPDGRAMTRITHFGGGATHAFGPAWSPDGRKIVWHKIGPAVNQLFVVDRDGGNERQLTRMPGNPKLSHPDWGPAR
jgi:TolB protein